MKYMPDQIKGFRPKGWARDLIGYRNGRLTALEPVGRNAAGLILWRCVCNCGNETVVPSTNLTKNGGTRSCGCLRKEAAVKSAKNRGAPWNKGKTYAINKGERVYTQQQNWAKAVIRARGNQCENCGWKEARCDAHHRIPRSKGGQNTIANGIVLCPNHHRIAHDSGEYQEGD